jgi:hypothetical protein
VKWLAYLRLGRAMYRNYERLQQDYAIGRLAVLEIQPRQDGFLSSPTVLARSLDELMSIQVTEAEKRGAKTVVFPADYVGDRVHV